MTFREWFKKQFGALPNEKRRLTLLGQLGATDAKRRNLMLEIETLTTLARQWDAALKAKTKWEKP